MKNVMSGTRDFFLARPYDSEYVNDSCHRRMKLEMSLASTPVRFVVMLSSLQAAGRGVKSVFMNGLSA